MLKRFAYLPKLAGAFVLSLFLWVFIGTISNWILFYAYAYGNRHVVINFMILVVGFPLLYLLVGKMWAVTGVLKRLAHHHAADFAALTKPLLAKALGKAGDKIGSDNLAAVRRWNDAVDEKAPWIIRVVFKAVKGDFIQSVVKGEVKLNNEADLDRVLQEALRRFAKEKRETVMWIAGVLLALNIGFLIYLIIRV